MLPSGAQEKLGSATDAGMSANRQLYSQAESEYQIGRLEEALTLLNSNIDKFEGSIKQSAYRLIALCYYGLDKDREAELSIRLLLKENPYYTPLAQDPIRFADYINSIRAGQTATVYTASIQAEKLEETPVPVTLISEEMIKRSGARNLKELLLIYVPGMTNVECNEEMNIAMRGIYSSGQEKILIMLNGHRLNSYCTNVARPDYSISLDKIKQIEVLRGPASSLYGGVALTAVINIITKNGTEVDGLKLKGGVGNYEQLKGDVIFGNHFMDVDVMAWASIYQARGERITIPEREQLGVIPVPGSIYIGAYNKKPTYDLGVTITWKGLSFMHNSNYSKTVAPYSMSYFFAPYSYDTYKEFDGNAPGYANYAHHNRLMYDKTWGNLHFSTNVTYDQETQVRYQVAGDFIPDVLDYRIVPTGTTDSILITNGAFQYHQWDEENLGMAVQASYGYQLGKSHHGTLSAGLQFNHFHLSDSHYQEGHLYDVVLSTFGEEKNLAPGRENSSDAYLQIKHQWKDFIVNAGIRYDNKHRRNSVVINEFSPRLALIYMLPKWNIKLSYSKAFVDAPYFYRYNTLDTTMGGEDLMSEYLHSLQFTLSSLGLAKGLNMELNLYYNMVKNLVYSENLYISNAGKQSSVGAELSTSYQTGKLLLNANASLQRLLDFEYFSARDHDVSNIPSLTADVTVSYRFLKQLSLHANLSYIGKQISFYEMMGAEGYVSRWIDINPYAILRIGTTFNYKALELNFNVHNLTNKKYEQGGSSIAPIRQQGLWLMADIAYKF